MLFVVWNDKVLLHTIHCSLQHYDLNWTQPTETTVTVAFTTQGPKAHIFPILVLSAFIRERLRFIHSFIAAACCVVDRRGTVQHGTELNLGRILGCVLASRHGQQLKSLAVVIFFVSTNVLPDTAWLRTRIDLKIARKIPA